MGVMKTRNSSGSHGRPKVVLVEDDRQVRRCCGRILQRLGYDVAPAASASAGLRILLYETRVDVLLTDVALPDGSGLGLVESCRRLHPETHIVVMSGTVDAGAVAPLQVRFLPKPFEADDLRGAIQDGVAGLQGSPCTRG